MYCILLNYHTGSIITLQTNYSSTGVYASGATLRSLAEHDTLYSLYIDEQDHN